MSKDLPKSIKWVPISKTIEEFYFLSELNTFNSIEVLTVHSL